MIALRFHDTTLRKGDESPGGAISSDDRLRIARALSDAGVDVVEAGFPAASPAVAAAVARVAAEVADASIAAFARLDPRDVDIAWAAIKNARQPRLVTAIALSDDHLALRLSRTRSSVLDAIDCVVRRCATYTAQVTFIAVDAGRCDREFLVRALERASNAGADTVVVADSVGYCQPAEFADLVEFVRQRLPSRTTVAAQCSNDLGLAVANTLAAVRAGAGEIHVTVNGIGPRAGIAALEEVSAALLVRDAYYRIALNVQAEKLPEISAMVAAATAMPVAPNKAVVGRNAFLHESGVDQAGVIQRSSLYEIIPARSVGRMSAELHLGRQSGRSALAVRSAALGVRLTRVQLDMAYRIFMSIAEQSREVSDTQLAQIAILVSEAILPDERPAGLGNRLPAAQTVQDEFETATIVEPTAPNSRMVTG